MSVTDLPPEVWHHIFSHCSDNPRDCAALSATCKPLRRVAVDCPQWLEWVHALCKNKRIYAPMVEGLLQKLSPRDTFCALSLYSRFGYAREALRLLGSGADTEEDCIENYAGRVSDAHSWYKHLSMSEVHDFLFFLSPVAGCRFSSKMKAWVDQCEGDGSRFHYTWTPTANYRQRYGYWSNAMREASASSGILCARTRYNLELRVHQARGTHLSSMMHSTMGDAGTVDPFLQYLLLGRLCGLDTVDLTQQIPASLLEWCTKRHTKPHEGLSPSLVSNLLRVVNVVAHFNSDLKGAVDAGEPEEASDAAGDEPGDEVEKLRRSKGGQRLLDSVKYEEAMESICEEKTLRAMTNDFEGRAREVHRDRAVAKCRKEYEEALANGKRDLSRVLTKMVAVIEAHRLCTKMHAAMQSVTQEIRELKDTASSFMCDQWLKAIDDTVAGLKFVDAQ
eukprot:TRINITY_DN15942_c0_g1_i1.p1 TRINITY_DN15942_c0_g1~~TRINITY_DN15942_c0_g1_i1.p1  ORF type:complete len:455 (-),score=83.64 TRINITY_DN15942_c0_g1_i1:50-1393(-)